MRFLMITIRLLHDLHSFPTRRSSDLSVAVHDQRRQPIAFGVDHAVRRSGNADRKSTRLNSSHPSSSYAVFCLKKKKWRFGEKRIWLLRSSTKPETLRRIP